MAHGPLVHLNDKLFEHFDRNIFMSSYIYLIIAGLLGCAWGLLILLLFRGAPYFCLWPEGGLEF